MALADWSVVIGDPGPLFLFDPAVYYRGAMTVHMRGWRSATGTSSASARPGRPAGPGGHGTIPQFIRLAERISGEQLDDLFEVWLFTGSKPVLEAAAAAQATAAAPSVGAMETMRR